MEVKDFPNYLIFRNGAVLSKGNKYNKAKFLKGTLNHKGYVIVNLYNSKPKTFQVHRLVALHYIPNPHNYPQVDHMNRVRNDNRLSNLRWADDFIQASNKKERGDQKNNTSGHRNISYYKPHDNWVFVKQKNKKSFRKYFKTLEEAIEFKQIGKFDYPLH